MNDNNTNTIFQKKDAFDKDINSDVFKYKKDFDYNEPNLDIYSMKMPYINCNRHIFAKPTIDLIDLLLQMTTYSKNICYR